MPGFAPIGTTDGADYHGKMRDVILDGASVLFIGDMVTPGGTPLAADEVERVIQAVDGTFGNVLIGSVVEFFPDFTDEGSLITNFHPAGVTEDNDQSIRVMYGSEVIYQCTDDDGATDGLDIGAAGDLAGTGTGDQITGISSQTANFDTTAVTNALILIGLAQIQGRDINGLANEYGNAGETQLLVRINEGGTT